MMNSCYVKCILLQLLFVSQVLAQCDREYPSGFYHNGMFVNAGGDTLNRLDSSGLYEGAHVYSRSEKNLYNDTLTYITGSFHHGLPVGDWLYHCKDGSYATGPFSVGGGESSYDGKGGWITRKQGIYAKIGIWKEYNANGQLQKTMCYERSDNNKGWTDRVFEKDTAGNFVLISYEYKSHHHSRSRFRNTIEENYTSSGVPVSRYYRSFWRHTAYDYDENGKLESYTRWRMFLGKEKRTSISKDYNLRGEVICRKKSWCKPRVLINEVW